MDKSKFRLVLNIVTAVAVFAAWIHMTLYGAGQLSQSTFGNLKYFTILSNLLEGIACIFWAISAARAGVFRPGDAADVQHSDGHASERELSGLLLHKAEVLKYVAAASVGITFITVMVFLGPLYGYPAMFSGPNLWLHLAVPVAALAESFFLCDTCFSTRDNLLAVVPVLLYGTAYLLNNMINGTGEWPDTNDWYSFLMWGYPVGIAIFAVICLVGWAIGRSVRKWGAGARHCR